MLEIESVIKCPWHAAPPVVTDKVLELAADLGKDEAARFEQWARQGRNEFIAPVDPKTNVSMGDTITLSVDTAQLHFFDPQPVKWSVRAFRSVLSCPNESR
jgi:hypothetical protein